MSENHAIRATRTEEAAWRVRYYPERGEELDEPDVRLEPHSETGRDVDPWEDIRCVCGATFVSFNEAAEHMDDFYTTDS